MPNSFDLTAWPTGLQLQAEGEGEGEGVGQGKRRQGKETSSPRLQGDRKQRMDDVRKQPSPWQGGEQLPNTRTHP